MQHAFIYRKLYLEHSDPLNHRGLSSSNHLVPTFLLPFSLKNCFLVNKIYQLMKKSKRSYGLWQQRNSSTNLHINAVNFMATKFTKWSISNYFFYYDLAFVTLIQEQYLNPLVGRPYSGIWVITKIHLTQAYWCIPFIVNKKWVGL